MAKLPDESLYQIFQNGTIEQVSEAVDTQLRSLGKIILESVLSSKQGSFDKLFWMR